MSELVLDNSAISLLSCKRRFQLTVLEGLYLSRGKDAAFGDAYHKAQEYIDKGSNLEEALSKAGTDDVNNLKLVKALTFFRASKNIPPPLVIDGVPFVERKFKFKYKTVERFKDEPIDVYLAGTIDRLHLDEKLDMLILPDYKTAVDVSEYGIKKKMASYELTFQLPFYTYCLLHSGLLPAEYVDYLTQRKYRTEIWFCFYNCEPMPEYRKLIKPAFNEDFLLREVPLIIDQKIMEAINVLNMGNKTAPHDGMNTYKACDYCMFRPACLSMGSARETEILDRFQRRIYDPLSFR